MDGMIRADEVSAIYPLSRSRLYEQIVAGEFPPPVKIGERASAWFEDEVRAMVRARASGLKQSVIRAMVSEMTSVREKKDAARLREAIVARYLGGRP